MTHRALNSRHSIESCTLQLHSWRPFQQLQTLTKTLESDQTKNGFHCKRPCLSDRTTTFSIDNLDMSKLNIIEDERSSVASYNKRESFRWIARKRRRRGSRSVSGRSSDTHRCCSVGASAAHATCSDFLVAAGGTDSSGEFFVNGEANWSSDVSEVRNTRKKEVGKGKDNGGGEKENLGSGCLQIGVVVVDAQGNESGYGSEPGYRGDAEFGYGDELDEEEDDGRLLFWGGSRDKDGNMEMVEENTFSDQRAHYRCRRKKHDWRMVDLPR